MIEESIKPKTFSKTYLLDKLKDGIVKVTFIKKNGVLREMNCTLKKDFLDEHNLNPKGTGKVKVDNDLISVVDSDINAWRSFDINKVVDVKID